MQCCVRALFLPEIRLQLAAVNLAEELNFTRAAERLRITQPALSKQISDLESQVGFLIFQRSQRRVELTDDIRDWGKTKKSLSVIHIPKQLADDLQAWRLECEEKAREAFAKGKRKSASLSPDDFIFENEDGGFLDTDNYRKRVLHK